MKKLMILGAGVYQVPILTRAKEKGYYTIAVSPDGDYPGLQIADKVYYIDVRDKEKVLEAAAAEKIDGITTDQTDLAMETIAYVAEHLGLPGISYECARLFTDKSLMRIKGEQLGIPTIRSRVTDTAEEAADFLKELGRPAMIKPVDNQGSRGIFLVHNAEELQEHYDLARSFSKTGRVIIEQYVKGREFEVDSLVYDYKAKTLMYADVVLFDIPGIFASKTRIYPSAADPKEVENLLEYNRQIIEGFGLQQGITHSEFIMDEDGQPYLLEAAARGGGAFVSSHITKLQTGLDTADFLIDLALGHITEMPAFERNLCHCGGISFYLPVGKVVSTEGIEEAKQLPYMCAHRLDDIQLGMQTETFSDKTARYISVLRADSREELLAHIDEYRKTIRIKVETAEGIQGPIWG